MLCEPTGDGQPVARRMAAALDDDQWSAPVRAVRALPPVRIRAAADHRRGRSAARPRRALLAAIEDDRHAVVRLQAEATTLRQRIVERAPDGWPGLDPLLTAPERLASVIAGLDGEVALAVGTERDRPPAAADRIRVPFPSQLRPGSR
jgi:hypothetical protein